MKNFILILWSILLSIGVSNVQAQSVEFKVERLNDDTYQVVMKPSVTWTTPNNNTLGLQVTLLAPTGSLQITSLTDVNGIWSALPTVVAPTENPTKDYFVIYMPSSAELPYTAGVETPLFTFKRVGACTGTVELINNTTDPFMPPNSRSFNVGNYVATSGGGGSGRNLWTANFGTTATCPRDCQIEYRLIPLSTGRYQVSMIPKINLSGVLATTATQQVTIVAPNGFLATRVTNLVSGATYRQTSRYDAPTENTSKDYLVFTLQNLGTTTLSYAANVEVPLFTFDNTGACGTGLVALMNNTTDPFKQPNSRTANVGQQITTIGAGIDMPICLSTDNSAACSVVPCQLEYKLIPLSTGKYQVSMIPKTTWSGIAATTATQQVTIVVPTGGFNATNVTNLVSGATYRQTSRYDAPTENTGKDYLIFTLQNLGTTTLSYVANVEVPLFTFDNVGTCGTGLVELMNNATDLYKTPNSGSNNVGQQITTIGGGIDVPICLNTSYSAACSVVPATCQLEYKLIPLSTGKYQVSMIPKVNWSGTLATTATQQVTIVVPTGGFNATNVTNLVSGATYRQTSRYNAPTENTGKDYLIFTLQNLGTTTLSYVANVEVPLFTFDNTGNCGTGLVELMNNATDLYKTPNSGSTNVGQQITTIGGGIDVPICLNTSYSAACSAIPCQLEYKLIPLSTGKYQVSMIPKTTWFGTAATTATQQVTIVVPTGGFNATNVISLVSGATYRQTSRFNAPTENTGKDYLIFTLQNLGTTTLSYIAGVEVPLFTFDNTGICRTGLVELMNNITDAYRKPNSGSTNVGQQITTIGGGVDVPICLHTQYSAACGVTCPKPICLPVTITRY